MAYAESDVQVWAAERERALQAAGRAYLSTREEERRRWHEVLLHQEATAPLLATELAPPEALIAGVHDLVYDPTPGSLGHRPVLVTLAGLPGDDQRDHYAVFLITLWDQKVECEIVSRPAGTLGHIARRAALARRALSPRRAGWQLWDGLLPLIGEHLLQPWRTRLEALNPSLLLLVGEGLFQPLPLEAADIAPNTPLLERYPVVRLPNAALASSLAARQQQVAELPTGRLVLGPPGRDLPAASLEASFLGQRWGLTDPLNPRPPFSEERMTVAKLLNWIARQPLAVLHLATHSDFNPLDYLLSAISFNDRPLTLKTLLTDDRFTFTGLQFCALSSCSGARQAGDELPGLVWSLVRAGAAAVQASLWDTADGAAFDMTEGLYRYWEDQGVALPVAFQKAVGLVRREHPHPAHWAPFVLSGYTTFACGPTAVAKG